MVNEIGLRNTLGDLESFKEQDLETLKTIKYKGNITHKEKSLYLYSAVDIYCNTRNPLFTVNEDELQNTILVEDKTLFISNIIFTGQEKIELHSCNNLKIYFQNCIFLTHISLESIPKSIQFDNCYFKKLNINNSYPNTNITSCVFEELIIDYYKNSISISYSEIGSLSIFDCLESSELSFYKNRIHNFAIENTKTISGLNYQQFLYLKDGLSSNFSKKIKKLINYKKDNKNDLNINKQLYTLNFIKDLEEIREKANLCNEIDLLKNKILPRPWFQKALLNFCGYFMCPGKIVIEMLVTILICSLFLYFIKKQESNLFYYLEQSFNSFFCSNKESLTFWEKILCYLENIFGFLEMNVFTISLAKKYLK